MSVCVVAEETAGGFLPRISHDCNPALGTADVEVICKAWLILKLPKKLNFKSRAKGGVPYK